MHASTTTGFCKKTWVVTGVLTIGWLAGKKEGGFHLKMVWKSVDILGIL
jgi:hypothetical protein